jgi:hypothetical protein
MTELTDNPQPHPRDEVEPDSATEDIRPNLKRHWNRRWRRYLFALFALIPAIFLTLIAISVMRSHGCRLVGYIPDGGTTVEVDLRQVLADVPGPVVVWACLDERCVRHVGSSDRWTYFADMNAALTDPETVDVRVVVRDHGRVVFDHGTRLVELDEDQPNGPGCEPTFFSGVVQARPEGDLVQQ